MAARTLKLVANSLIKLANLVEAKVCMKPFYCTVYLVACLERPPPGPYKCGLSRQVVFGDRFNYIEI